MRKNYNKFSGAKDIAPGVSVEVRDGEFNRAMKLFIKKANDAGIVKEVRDRQYYTKKTTKRKQAKQMARKRWLKKKARLDPINSTDY